MDINLSLVKARFEKATQTYNDNAQSQLRIVQRLFSMLEKVRKNPPKKILEIGSGTGLLTKMLLEAYNPERFVAIDLCYNQLSQTIKDRNQLDRIEYICDDAEKVDFDEKFDLIISTNTFQWFKDLDTFVRRISEALEKDGIFAMSCFDRGNLREIESITGRGLSYLGQDKIREIISCHLFLTYEDKESVVSYFPTSFAVLENLKLTGVTAINEKTWTKGDMENFDKVYKEQFCDENGFSLTYEAIYFLAKKI